MGFGQMLESVPASLSENFCIDWPCEAAAVSFPYDAQYLPAPDLVLLHFLSNAWAVPGHKVWRNDPGLRECLPIKLRQFFLRQIDRGPLVSGCKINYELFAGRGQRVSMSPEGDDRSLTQFNPQVLVICRHDTNWSPHKRQGKGAADQNC